MIIVVMIIITVGAVWFIRRKKRFAIVNHVYEEIGPPTHDLSYNHLNFRNLPPNNCILDHYNNGGRQNQRSQNNENDLDIGENIEMGEQYNRLNFDTPPNNEMLEHYDNSKPNQDDQCDADEAEVLEVDPPNDGPTYNHLRLGVPAPNRSILGHYKNAQPQPEENYSSESSESE